MTGQLNMDREDIYTFIEKCRAYLVDQLQKEVVDAMFERNVITEEEYHEITSYEQREHQIVCILDKLPEKSGDNFYIFYQYVNDWYKWILESCHRSQSETENNDIHEVEKILDECNVPPLPSRHVRRKEEHVTLCNRLHELKRNEYIVVHGMRGCGKSTLVAQVLRNSSSLTLDAFKRKVFWLTIGRESSFEEFTVQQELCAKLISHRGYNSQTLPLDSKSAKQFLKERLKSDELEDCLLVLDDVSSTSFINALDVGCKILVTTDDKDIMNRTDKKIHYIKISEGFTEEETLRLFSQSIGSEKLPSQAKHIHSICKGFPMTISLISSQLEEHKEDVLNTTDRWDVYVAKLKEKDISSAIGRYDRYRLEQVTSLYKAIGMSIDSLDPDLKYLYQDLALFMDDVNIKPEVLCTLWEVSKKEVEDIMIEFERKCLIIRAWNRLKMSYIYCVHDLLLDYLKRQFTALEIQKLHLKLIRKYQKKFGTDFNNFPVEDNYIYLYLGYHLKEADLGNTFPILYFNLSFLEKKIMNFGVADLLHDFRKYRTLIANNDAENTKKYEDFVHFIKRIGVCKSISNSDIIQFGLCEYKESSVYKIAKEMMQNSKISQSKKKVNKYFEFVTDIPIENSPPTVYYAREDVVVAIFASDDNIIIANSFGIIKLINIRNDDTLMTFKGHTKKVTLLRLTKSMFYFLSASDDATVCVWYLNDYSNLESSSYFDKPRTPSPQFKQNCWYDPWAKQRHSGETAVAILDKHSVPVKHASFSNNGTMVVTTATDFKLIIWKFGFEKKKNDFTMNICGHHVVRTKEVIECCCFSNNDEFVISAAQKGIIFVYSSTDGILLSSVTTDYKIKSMTIIPEMPHVSALILGEDYFYVLDITPEKVDSVVLQCKKRYQTGGRKRDDYYICASVSWDGKYVAIASINYSFIVYDIQNGKEILKFNESNGRICGLSWSQRNRTILTFYQNSILKIWHMEYNGVLENIVKLKSSVFDAAWIPYEDSDDPNNEDLLVTAALNNNNEIVVFFDLSQHKIITPETGVEINQICVCPVDGHITYCSKNGSVFLVRLDQWDSYCIIKNVQCIRIHKLKTFCFVKKLLVIVLVEIESNKFSLVGWRKDTDVDNISGKVLTYESKSNSITEFSVDFKTNSLYVVKSNHQLSVYDADTAILTHEESSFAEFLEAGHTKFCDISLNFSHVATGNNRVLILRKTENGKKTLISFDTTGKSAATCKFNYDGKTLIVGYFDGSIDIYETESCTNMSSFPNVNLNPFTFDTGKVIDLFLASTATIDSRILVVFDREVALYEFTYHSQRTELSAILYMSVDKIVCNRAFNRGVTIDSNGHFVVLKFPPTLPP